MQAAITSLCELRLHGWLLLMTCADACANLEPECLHYDLIEQRTAGSSCTPKSDGEFCGETGSQQCQAGLCGGERYNVPVCFCLEASCHTHVVCSDCHMFWPGNGNTINKHHVRLYNACCIVQGHAATT